MEILSTLGTDNTSRVDPEDIASAVTTLCHFKCQLLKIAQLNCMISNIATSVELQLQSLDIPWNNLSECDPDTLATEVYRLHSVVLKGTHLTVKQTIALTAMIGKSPDLKLHTINLSGNNLSQVPGHTLARAVCRLQTVVLKDTQLSNDQVTTVLTFISSTTDLKLTKLTFSTNLLSKIEIVEDILKKACHKVKIL